MEKKTFRDELGVDGVGFRGGLGALGGFCWKSESGMGPGASLERIEPSEELVAVRELLEYCCGGGASRAADDCLAEFNPTAADWDRLKRAALADLVRANSSGNWPF